MPGAHTDLPLSPTSLYNTTSYTTGTREGGRASQYFQRSSRNNVHLALLPLTFLPSPSQAQELPKNVISLESWVRNGSFTDNQLGQKHNDQMREASAGDIPSPRPRLLEKPGSKAQGQRGERPQGRAANGTNPLQNITKHGVISITTKDPNRRQWGKRRTRS